ncbi:methylenomycin A resistance protein [Apiospora aurea]|uniref:Methylenomycin A resistance protein n=1 Tax=Apiospora aurea TaxID=335848 RepID=A0ABR1QM67_9PEZI
MTSGASISPKDEMPPPDNPQKTSKGPRFWAIMGVLALTSLLTALEATITSTVLPVIVSDLNGGSGYIWVANAYFLTMASLQPMFGQLANVFGRRWPMIFSAACFVLGSGICGGATNMAMLIAGRVIQGIGGSGISVLCETIICDLMPLRERGTYMAAVLGMVALGTSLGPLFGGLIVSYSTWRWAFYLALPIGAPALALLFLFLHVKYDRSSTLATKTGRLDWLGNAVFVGASCAVLIALSWAGSEHPWSSSQVLAPLLVGVAGLAGFLALEASPRLAPNPMMPLHLFASRTTSAVFAVTFLHGLVTIWSLYFLPVYFQGVLGASPYRSGAMLLPTILALIPAAIAGGLLLSETGRYKPLLVVAMGLITVGFGLFSLLDENSGTAAWVGFQIVQALGAGLALPTLLPALLAPLSDRDTALATGTWAFMRSFGIVWGVAIAGTVYSTRAAALAPAVITGTPRSRPGSRRGRVPGRDGAVSRCALGGGAGAGGGGAELGAAAVVAGGHRVWAGGVPGCRGVAERNTIAKGA